jgi:CheY-like chemotaxis protein
LKQIKILVVDDHAHYLRIVSAWLANLPGITHVASAASGPDALRLFESAPLDLVLTDFHMPGMNGIEMTKSVRSRGNGTVIVITSLTGSPELHDAAIRNGAHHFVVKTQLFKELPLFLAKQFRHSLTSA